MAFHFFTPNNEGWTTVGDDLAFANPYLEVHRVTVTSPTRPEPFTWTVCHRKAAVVIAAQDADGRFIMIRQERVPIRSTIWEMPAGQIDEASGQDENAIRETGIRELLEESGYEPAPDATVESLGYFFPSAGFTDEHSHLLLIRPVVLNASGPKHDDSEAITECRAFSAEELREMIASSEIRDANTLAAYARLVAMRLIP